MRVLVTGGTGVVGRATVDALLAHGHEVRLFSRNAQSDVEEWPHRTEPYPGDVSNEVEVRGAADGCDAVIHLTAIVAESPPDVTFEKVNVAGTRNVVREAERAGVKRFVYVSSLGADRGQSPYHQSKLRGEEVVRTLDGNFVIVRLGNVYGNGDEQLSLILKMVRTLPAIPVFAGGDRPFQPIWAEDAGEALAIAAERDDLAGRVLELARPRADDVRRRRKPSLAHHEARSCTTSHSRAARLDGAQGGERARRGPAGRSGTADDAQRGEHRDESRPGTP